jgi:Fe-Mn family superoxide dismutase
MAREAKNFEYLLGGKAKGLSDLQLKEHFTLYEGYVTKLNEIWEKLRTVDRSAPNYSFDEYSELKRREPVAFNGTVLHELYFENLGNGSTKPDPDAIVSFDYTEKRLFNNLIRSEHDTGLMANTHIMMALDAWEHAYFLDYQTKKEDYVANVLSGLNWDVINRRLRAGGSPIEKAKPSHEAVMRH